jgi:chemotaxis signal transduction protein
MNGFVQFDVGGRSFAIPLHVIREVVRGSGVVPLPGARAPFTGTLEVRGAPLPIADLRSHGTVGDVLVIADDEGERFGVAVDMVRAVHPASELLPLDEPSMYGLPDYIHDVRHVDGSTVYLVDVTAMVQTVPGEPVVAVTG